MSSSEPDPDHQLEPESQKFVPRSDDDEQLWPVLRITAERGKNYKVIWAGEDPKTGKPWPQSWVPKKDCTPDLVNKWKAAQERKRARKSKERKSNGTATKSPSKSAPAANAKRTRTSSTVRADSNNTASTSSRTAKGRSTSSTNANKRKRTASPASSESPPPAATLLDLLPSTRKKRRLSVDDVDSEDEVEYAEPAQSSHEVKATKRIGKVVSQESRSTDPETRRKNRAKGNPRHNPHSEPEDAEQEDVPLPRRRGRDAPSRSASSSGSGRTRNDSPSPSRPRTHPSANGITSKSKSTAATTLRKSSSKVIVEVAPSPKRKRVTASWTRPITPPSRSRAPKIEPITPKTSAAVPQPKSPLLSSWAKRRLQQFDDTNFEERQRERAADSDTDTDEEGDWDANDGGGQRAFGGTWLGASGGEVSEEDHASGGDSYDLSYVHPAMLCDDPYDGEFDLPPPITRQRDDDDDNDDDDGEIVPTSDPRADRPSHSRPRTRTQSPTAVLPRSKRVSYVEPGEESIVPETETQSSNNTHPSQQAPSGSSAKPQPTQSRAEVEAEDEGVREADTGPGTDAAPEPAQSDTDTEPDEAEDEDNREHVPRRGSMVARMKSASPSKSVSKSPRKDGEGNGNGKTMGRIPVVAPEVFRPYLPEGEESIEAWTPSPKKKSVHKSNEREGKHSKPDSREGRSPKRTSRDEGEDNDEDGRIRRRGKELAQEASEEREREWAARKKADKEALQKVAPPPPLQVIPPSPRPRGLLSAMGSFFRGSREPQVSAATTAPKTNGHVPGTNGATAATGQATEGGRTPDDAPEKVHDAFDEGDNEDDEDEVVHRMEEDYMNIPFDHGNDMGIPPEYDHGNDDSVTQEQTGTGPAPVQVQAVPEEEEENTQDILREQERQREELMYPDPDPQPPAEASAPRRSPTVGHAPSSPPGPVVDDSEEVDEFMPRSQPPSPSPSHEGDAEEGEIREEDLGRASKSDGEISMPEDFPDALKHHIRDKRREIRDVQRFLEEERVARAQLERQNDELKTALVDAHARINAQDDMKHKLDAVLSQTTEFQVEQSAAETRLEEAQRERAVLEEDLRRQRATLEEQLTLVRSALESERERYAQERAASDAARAALAEKMDSERAAERSQWESERAVLSESVERASAGKADAERDREFFREQYGRASAFVSTTRAENVELERRIKVAEDQTRTGVASIRAMFENRVKSLNSEVAMLKDQARIMREVNERTRGEQIRREAAKAKELRVAGHNLLDQNSKLKEEKADLEGALGTADWALKLAEKEAGEWRKEVERIKAGQRTKRLRVRQSEGDIHVDGVEEMVYQCLWVPDGETDRCADVFRDMEELIEHSRRHVRQSE